MSPRAELDFEAAAQGLSPWAFGWESADGIDATSLFVLLGAVLVEEDAVSRFERQRRVDPRSTAKCGVEVDDDAGGGEGFDGADGGVPRALEKVALTSCWWLTPARKPWVKVREKVCSRSSFCWSVMEKGWPARGGIDGGAVGLGGGGDVVGGFEAAFDFEAGDGRVS